MASKKTSTTGKTGKSTKARAAGVRKLQKADAKTQRQSKAVKRSGSENSR